MNFAPLLRSPLTMALELRSSHEIDEWDYAYRRVEAYLQACGIGPRILLTEIAVGIVEKARERAANGKSKDTPVTLAMGVLFEQMRDRFQQFLAAESQTEEHCRARGRLALATSGEALMRAKVVFDKQPASPELLNQSFDDRPLQTGPELRLSKLPPAQIEYAFGDADDETSLVPRRVPFAAMAVVLSLVGAMGAAWAATH